MSDVRLAEKIHGPAINVLKGKTTRTKPIPVPDDRIEVPPELKLKHQGVNLCADIMFIQGVIFLITISREIKFVTVTCIPSRSLKQLCEGFDNTFGIHNAHGFRIETVFADPEFQKVDKPMVDNDIELNVANAKEHVAEIERCIRTHKEGFRCQVHRLPFMGQMPKVMIRGLSCMVAK